MWLLTYITCLNLKKTTLKIPSVLRNKPRTSQDVPGPLLVSSAGSSCVGPNLRGTRMPGRSSFSSWLKLLVWKSKGYPYLGPPRVSNFSPRVWFLMVKGPKFQTLGGFRYVNNPFHFQGFNRNPNHQWTISWVVYTQKTTWQLSYLVFWMIGKEKNEKKKSRTVDVPLWFGIGSNKITFISLKLSVESTLGRKRP